MQISSRENAKGIKGIMPIIVLYIGFIIVVVIVIILIIILITTVIIIERKKNAEEKINKKIMSG